MSYICRCLAPYSGVDSSDGDGCLSNSIKTVGPHSTGGKQGLLLTVGEGADVYVQAGGALRGEFTSVLQQARDLRTLLGDDTAPGLVADNAQAIADLELTLSSLIRKTAEERQQMFDMEMTQVKLDIRANTRAMQANADGILNNVAAIQVNNVAIKEHSGTLRENRDAITVSRESISINRDAIEANRVALEANNEASIERDLSMAANAMKKSYNMVEYVGSKLQPA